MRLEVSEKAVATSGISRRKWEREGKRFHHLIHPKHPANFSFELRTVSVIADSAEEADITAKILFIQSEEERKKFTEGQNIAAVFYIIPAMPGFRPRPNHIAFFREKISINSRFVL